MARWITVQARFDYRWPNRTAITHFSDDDLGDHYVKDEVADFAVAGGYATEGKSDEASRSKKTRKRSAAEEEPPADETTNSGTVAGVADAGDADADRSADRPAVDPDAE